MPDIKEVLGVKRLAANADFIMQMRAIYPAGLSHFADHCAGHDIGTFFCRDAGQMRVCRCDVKIMLDPDNIAKGAHFSGKTTVPGADALTFSCHVPARSIP